MACIGEINAGADRARAELLFLVRLLVQLGDRVEPQTEFTGTLGLTDVYRNSAFRADDFIRVEKPSISLLEDIAALRIRALKRVRQSVEIATSHCGLAGQPNGGR